MTGPAPLPGAPSVVITGASQGLGRAVAEYLAAQRYRLIITARHPEPLDATAVRLRALGASVVAVAGDVADPGHRARVVDAVGAGRGLGLLVHNASELGASPLPKVLDAEPETFRRVYEVNVIAPVQLTRALRAPLVRGRGLVVHVSSDAAEGAYPGWGVYGSSKAALDLLSRTLAKELASDRISVVAFDPGDMRTALHQAAFPGEDISDRPLPETVVPFFAWLIGQDRTRVTGQRLRARAETWELAAV